MGTGVWEEEDASSSDPAVVVVGLEEESVHVEGGVKVSR